MVAVTLLALMPLLAPGFVLTYDMVFVPHLAFTRDLFGLGTAVPRAVPNDLLVAATSRIVPALVIQKLILAGIFLGAGIGAARLTPSARPSARAAAGVFYTWNAFVFERLLIGHWTLLVGYAALPWVVEGAASLRSGKPGAARRLVAALAVATFGSPYGGVIAGMVALLVAGIPARRPSPERGGPGAIDTNPGVVKRPRRVPSALATVATVILVLNLPWLVPSLLRPGGLPVRTAAVTAFGAQADSRLGVAGSLLTLGGIWNGNVVPADRAGWAWIPAMALMLALAANGWRLARRRWPDGAASGLLTAAAIGFVLALAPAVPGLRHIFAFLAAHAPGGGLLRDSQKFVMPLALVEAVGFGLGIERLLAAVGDAGRRWGAAVALAAVVAPVAVLPSLAWGAATRLGTATYPDDWARARTALAADPVPGAALVLPWHLYLAFPWNGHRVVLDPAQRFFDRRMVVNDDLELTTGTIRGEDPWSDLAGPVVRATGPLEPGLSDAGIDAVVVLKVGDWRSYVPRLSGLARVVDGPTLSLYRGPPPAHTPSFPTPPVAPVVVGDVAALLMALWAFVPRSLLRRRGRSPRGELARGP